MSAEELMLLNVVLEKTPESPLDCKEIQPVHSKGDQSWVFFGRNDAKAVRLPVTGYALVWGESRSDLTFTKTMFFVNIGRSGWTRTIDLTLIRRAL